MRGKTQWSSFFCVKRLLPKTSFMAHTKNQTCCIDTILNKLNYGVLATPLSPVRDAVACMGNESRARTLGGPFLGPNPNAPKHEAGSPCEAPTWMNVGVIVTMHTHYHTSADEMNHFQRARGLMLTMLRSLVKT